MSFQRKRKRWSAPGLDPAKSLEIWKARHPHEDIPVDPAPKLLAPLDVDPANPRCRPRWPSQTDSNRASHAEIPASGKALGEDAFPPLPVHSREDQGEPPPEAQILETDDPSTSLLRGELGSTDPDAGTERTVAEPTEGKPIIDALPGVVVGRSRSLVLRLIRLAVRFVRKPRSRQGRETKLPAPPYTKGLGGQVDEFVELLTSGNALSTDQRDRLLMALRGGLGSGEKDAPPVGFQGEKSKAVKVPHAPASTPIATPIAFPVEEPNPSDPNVELHRRQELRAKDRQIEILESKMRALAAMLKEQERRNAKAMKQAAQNRSRLPGLSRLQRKSPAQLSEGTSDLMLGIREMNRQIREEIQSMYANGAKDPRAAMTPADELGEAAD